MVVIGGGIIGVFAAYYLAQRGVSVALVEKGRIGAEQSSRNWGWCRQQNRDARELPIATKSLDLWERFAAETGEDTGFHRCGLLYLSNDEAELSRWSSWCDFAKTAGVTTYMLDSRQAAERGQATGRAWKGGVFSPSDGTADPAKAAPAVASCAHEARWQRPPELRGPRHRVGGRGGQRRRHGSGRHQDQNGDTCGWRLGVLVLPPTRHPFPPGLDPPIHP